ncbi:Protein EMSY-LIKE 1 [Cardamine amara subsp. amara]|uniref:Protein EMSY-LIKE 1 n=1 Tax=Cardamine amara subsp. amara TaxID=228776 RepID=A0ABD0ZG17_CARAN
MSNQQHQAPNPPSQLIGLPLKKRDFAETMPSNGNGDLDSVSEEFTGLPLKKRDFAETMPSNGNGDLLLLMNKKEKLDYLQKQAYYNVLHAFNAESPKISSPRILIVKDLTKEWNIDHTTHAAFEKTIKTDPMVKKFRKVSLPSDEVRKITAVDGNPLKIRIPKKEDVNKTGDKVIPAKIQDVKVIVPEKLQNGKVKAPAKTQEEKAKPTSTSDDSPVSSWGQVSPGSLVGRWVYIRMPGEEDHLAFLIKQYNAQTETHRLVSTLSHKNFDDPCDWIDLRHIPAKDIIWKEGNPGLPVRKCFLKPGETLLLETSTAQKTKQLKQAGKSSSGIPIIRKMDKGKSIVGAESPLQ